MSVNARSAAARAARDRSGHLLDSHTVLWYLTDEGRLSRAVVDLLADPAERVVVSDVTLYELMFKARRGRLPAGLLRLPEALSASGLRSMPITTDALIAAAALDWAHGDPWDRILLAQARLLDLSLVSRDVAFDDVSSRRIW